MSNLPEINVVWPAAGKPWDGLPMAKLGYTASLYFGGGFTTAVRGALLAIVEECIALASEDKGVGIRRYMRADDRRWLQANPNKPVKLERLRERVINVKSTWGIEMYSEKESFIPSDWSMLALSGMHTFLTASFPLSAMSFDVFRDLFLRWCRALDVDHAYAGLGLLGADAALKHLGPTVNRFVGLDLDHPGTIIRRCRTGIRPVNWLTAISDDRLCPAGGAQAVLEKTGPVIEAVRYGKGTLFVAGSEPVLGDLQAGEFPHAYARLGAAVAPLRADLHERWFEAPVGYQAPAGFTSKSGGGEAHPEELPALHYLKTWLARFDEEHPQARANRTAR